MNTSCRVLLVMSPDTFDTQFGPEALQALAHGVQLYDPPMVTSFDDAGDALSTAEVLLTSWGCPPITTEVLEAAPHLRAVVHAAGSVRGLLPANHEDCGIQVTSAAHLNAVPVAEYTLAAIIFAGKGVLPLAQAGRRRPGSWETSFATPGLSNFDRTVGIVGFSLTGQRVVSLLSVLDTRQILVADPYADPVEVAAAGAQLVPMSHLLQQADILSLHAPHLPETSGMIGPRELALLPDHATVINTARGALLDHDALLAECASGRLDAILDVTDPEPLPAGHPLLALANVTVTPHMAGSLGTETRRMADFAIQAVLRFAAGEPLPGARSSKESTVSA